ncbi:hypothetical protein [Actinacidiphila yanglinensis]|uniref:hypothetical protein n=1 Tax=Actinacidiphila yanglinensis TaxID=310779 RepID=UPI002B0014E2|nr:hypothetical protein [Actinacidiphila yanglinensis]
MAALVLWAVTSRGGGGGHGSSAPTSSHTPAATITPGPTPSGPHNGGEPGGRDTAPSDSSGATNGGSGNGGTGGGSSSGDDTGGAGSGGGSTAGSDTAGSGGGSAGGGTGGAPAPGQQVPVGSTLATCAPGAVSLSLSSVHNSYQPGQDPEFRLVAANSSAVSCKIDVGPKSAVFTVTGAPGGSHVWASDDCPTTGSHLLQVPARSSMSYTLRWNGRNSSPQCAKPKGEQSAPGTYLVQLRKSGYGTQQASFQLSDD